MPSVTIAVSEALKREMDSHDDVNWSAVARRSIEHKLQIMKEMDEMLKNSKLTEEDAILLGRKVKADMARARGLRRETRR